MALKDIKARLLADFEAKLAEANKVCEKGTAAEFEGKLADLKKIENDYRIVSEKEAFAACADVHEALVKHHFSTISHKKVSNNGVMEGVERSDRNVQIDIRRFCEHKGLDTGWYYEMQSLNKRLTLKVATELGVTAKEIKAIDGSYKMDKLAAEIELGKTPTSDTQCIKHIQKVLDMLSDGEGRVNSHDLTYIWLCYAKKSNKDALRVVCSKHSILQSLLTDVFHRVATKGVYGADCKRIINDVEGSSSNTEPDKSPKDSKKVPEPETVVAKKTEAAA